MAPERPDDSWYRGFTRKFTPFEVLILVIGAALGLAGNAIFAGRQVVVGLIAVSVLAIAAMLAVDRLGVRAAQDLDSTNESLRKTLQQHYNDMEDQLRSHLSHVHASVEFVPDGSVVRQGSSTRPGYDVAELAVRGARRRVWVIGDYSPPPEFGAQLDSSRPPENRSSYLSAIEDMLRLRCASDEELPVLEYRRYIQRPVAVYEQIASRAPSMRGITLTGADMSGDVQAFNHCARILQIAAGAARDRPVRIRVDLRVIPFLPNCPSVLIVDDEDVQFTIPTRIDRPDDFSSQGLFGVLAMKDKAQGSNITYHFRHLFNHLTNISIPIIKVEGATVPGVEVAPADVELLRNAGPSLSETA